MKVGVHLMDMHEDYSNDKIQHGKCLCMVNDIMKHIDGVCLVESMSRANSIAIRLAKKHTDRSKILFSVDPLQLESYNKATQNNNIKIIPAGDREKLCESIATSFDRIAAIVIKPFIRYQNALPYYDL